MILRATPLIHDVRSISLRNLDQATFEHLSNSVPGHHHVGSSSLRPVLLGRNSSLTCQDNCRRSLWSQRRMSLLSPKTKRQPNMPLQVDLLPCRLIHEDSLQPNKHSCAISRSIEFEDRLVRPPNSIENTIEDIFALVNSPK